MVPENIHTPTTEVIGNSEEVGGSKKIRYHTPTTEGIGNSEGDGGRESKTQEISEGRGLYDLGSEGPLIQYRFECQSSCSKTLSLLSRLKFHSNNSGLNEYLYLTRIIFEIHFLSLRSSLEANKCEECAVA